jgi:hypothetical protein
LFKRIYDAYIQKSIIYFQPSLLKGFIKRYSSFYLFNKTFLDLSSDMILKDWYLFNKQYSNVQNIPVCSDVRNTIIISESLDPLIIHTIYPSLPFNISYSFILPFLFINLNDFNEMFYQYKTLKTLRSESKLSDFEKLISIF